MQVSQDETKYMFEHARRMRSNTAAKGRIDGFDIEAMKPASPLAMLPNSSLLAPAIPSE